MKDWTDNAVYYTKGRKNSRKKSPVDYDKLCDAELYEMMRQRLPEIRIDQINDFNRQTVIAYLKISDSER